MASISSQRIGSAITWSLNFTTRSRSIAFNFSRLEPIRRQRHSNRSSNITQSPLRSFSTQTPRFQTTSTPPAAAAPNTRTPPPQTARTEANDAQKEPIREYQSGLSDMPPAQLPHEQGTVDWTRSFHGLSAEPFPKETSDILMQPLSYDDVEIKPDGIVFLPEIKYRRILNRAFGPGGWGLAPRGETIVTPKSVTREYALLAHGRLISVARGEMDYFDSEGIPTAVEGCKSNALTRCCKDLGIASELWDPRWIRKFLKERSREVWVEHAATKRRRKITLRKDDDVRPPYKEVKMSGASG